MSLCVVITLVLYFIIGAWVTPDVNKGNTTFVNGHFLNISMGVTKGDVWYNVILQESKNDYRIGADYSQCFMYDRFKKDVGYGQPIQIYLNKSIPFFSIRTPMIVGIVANNTEYLSFDCANEEIEKEKKVFPFLGIAVILLFVYVIYKKEIHKKLKDY